MIGWFICQYRQDAIRKRLLKIPMNDFNAQIRADGGMWDSIEIPNGRVLVKVRASAATLSAIAGTAGFSRVPLERLDDSLSALTAQQRTAIRGELSDAGFTNQEINSAIPNLASATVRDVFSLLSSRRITRRYDPVTETHFFDGAPRSTMPLTHFDKVPD